MAFGEHSAYPSSGGLLGSELLYNPEVGRIAVYLFYSFRLVRKARISHKFSTFIRFFVVIISAHYFIACVVGINKKTTPKAIHFAKANRYKTAPDTFSYPIWAGGVQK